MGLNDSLSDQGVKLAAEHPDMLGCVEHDVHLNDVESARFGPNMVTGAAYSLAASTDTSAGRDKALRSIWRPRPTACPGSQEIALPRCLRPPQRRARLAMTCRSRCRSRVVGVVEPVLRPGLSLIDPRRFVLAVFVLDHFRDLDLIGKRARNVPILNPTKFSVPAQEVLITRPRVRADLKAMIQDVGAILLFGGQTEEPVQADLKCASDRCNARGMRTASVARIWDSVERSTPIRRASSAREIPARSIACSRRSRNTRAISRLSKDCISMRKGCPCCFVESTIFDLSVHMLCLLCKSALKQRVLDFSVRVCTRSRQPSKQRHGPNFERPSRHRKVHRLLPPLGSRPMVRRHPPDRRPVSCRTGLSGPRAGLGVEWPTVFVGFWCQALFALGVAIYV